MLFLICAFCWGIEELQFYQDTCDLLKVVNCSYSSVSLRKETGGIAVCDVSLTKEIVGLAKFL